VVDVVADDPTERARIRRARVGDITDEADAAAEEEGDAAATRSGRARGRWKGSSVAVTPSAVTDEEAAGGADEDDDEEEDEEEGEDAAEEGEEEEDEAQAGTAAAAGAGGGDDRMFICSDLSCCGAWLPFVCPLACGLLLLPLLPLLCPLVGCDDAATVAVVLGVGECVHPILLSPFILVVRFCRWRVAGGLSASRRVASPCLCLCLCLLTEKPPK
jgi:hypothetical protein